jgi:hypothetical protein
MKRFHSIVLMLLFCAAGARSQQIAKYAGEFLSLGVGGRSLALGGAQAALVNDATAGYWNPAALTRVNYPELALMHDERYAGLVNYDYAAVALPYGTDATVGISLMRLGVDGIADTRSAGVDADGNPLPASQLENFDRLDYNQITYFNSANWAVYFSYAQKYSEKFSYGINVKILHESIADASATGFGFDIGALYMVSDRWAVAANAQDITTTLVAWSTGTNELISPNLKLGTACSFDFLSGTFSPAFDVDVRFENRRTASIAHLGPVSFDPHEGLEYEYKKTLALRIGYSDVKQMTLGAGLHFNKLDVDYSFARFGSENNLGDTHRISLQFILKTEKFARSAE